MYSGDAHKSQMALNLYFEDPVGIINPLIFDNIVYV